MFEKLRKRNIEQKRNAQFLACLLYTSHIGRIRERVKDNPDFEIVTMRGIGYKVVTVSYTHLDVYKRQVLTSLQMGLSQALLLQSTHFGF